MSTDQGQEPRAPDEHSELGSSSSERLNNRESSGWTIPDPASVEEHGRMFGTYREGAYFLPNDALEQNRLDLEHEMWKLILDEALSLVPFDKAPESVLDVGTGTGIWAIEFAQEHPDSQVLGTDISMIQPALDISPANCSFVLDDIEDEWIFDRSFDYVHLRSMLTCFNDHKSVLQKIFENLRPGGWVEYQDVLPQGIGKDAANEEAYQGSLMQVFAQRTVEAAALLGRDMMIARKYKQLMTEVGFHDVVERQILVANKPWPNNPKQRRIGQFMQANSLEALEAVSSKLLPTLGMSFDEINEFLARVRESIVDMSLQLYCPMYVVYGRKPYEWEQAKPQHEPVLAAGAENAQVQRGKRRAGR